MGDFAKLPGLDKRRQALLPALVWALGLHAGTYLLLVSLTARRPIDAPRREPQTIKVRIVGPAAPPRAPRPERPSPGPGRHPRPPRPSLPADPEPASLPSSPRYEELFPAPGSATGLEGEPAEADRPKPVDQGLLTATEELSGKLDIPLFFRAQAGDSKAVAKIARDASGALRFAYVEGTPLLRAVVYDALRTAANRALVAEWLDRMRTDEVVISFRLHAKKVSRPPTREEETLRFTRGRVIIERTMLIYEGGGASGLSISLPDEEADRAKLRDRIHLDRLLTSPAYHAPIRDRPLTEPGPDTL
jgi:hypothetical protein